MSYDLTTVERLYNLLRTKQAAAGEAVVYFKGDQNVKNAQDLGLISIELLESEFKTFSTSIDRVTETVRVMLTLDRMPERGNMTPDENTIQMRLIRIFQGELNQSYHPQSIMGILRRNLTLKDAPDRRQYTEVHLGHVIYPETNKDAANTYAKAWCDLTLTRDVSVLREG